MRRKINDFGSKMVSEKMLNLVSILDNDFVSFGIRLGSLLALFWEPSGSLGGSLCRQVGAKGAWSSQNPIKFKN